VDSDVLSGEISASGALHDPQNEERLAAFGSDGERLAEDRILLKRVMVEP
jgi:hypothetical protein